MARQKSVAQVTTLYRLHHTSKLEDVIKQKYRNDSIFSIEQCLVVNEKALLVTGAIGGQSQVKWAGRVKTLTGVNTKIVNQTAAGVLLLPSDTQANAPIWALCWGMGWLLLDQEFIDGAFGQRLALRSVNPAELNQLTRTVLDDRARVDRSSIPAGSELIGFGMGGFGEIITRIVGRARIEGLSISKDFRVRGADAVSLPLGLTPQNLLSDLQILEEVLKREPQRELKTLEQLVPIKKGTKLYKSLEDELLKEIHKSLNSSQIAVSWPHEQLGDNKPAESFRVKNVRDNEPKPDLPTVKTILELMKGKKIESLEKIKIQLYSDFEGDDAISGDIALRKWIIFETDKDGKRYFLHNGQWFAMDLSYAIKLNERVNEIFAKPSGLKMPPWKKSEDEAAYNHNASKYLSAVLMDRRLVQTPHHSRGFEASDLIVGHDVYVHVKSATSSAPLSHLFAQGSNSAHALQFDSEARNELRKRVKEAGGTPNLIGAKPRKIIFAIRPNKIGGQIDPDNLFSFSKVTLVRVADELEGRGIEVRIAQIEYKED